MSTATATTATTSAYSPLVAHWALDPAVTFLNHGSYGACPRVVLARQQELRARLESEPVRFLVRESQPLLDEARARVAALTKARPEDLVFVRNATSGVNAVLRSLPFAPGDELLITDHGYNACNNVVHHVAKASGAAVVVAKISFPIASEDDAVAGILAAVTAKTRFALIDHVTSATALVLPVKRITAELNARGVEVMIDGAHAPGMVPLDIPDIGASWYTGNCHKWLCAPKGAALLWIRADRQEAPAPIHPTVISHGYNDARAHLPRIWREFDWIGTDDPTATLCVPAALDFMATVVPGGLDEAMRRNRALALAMRADLAARLGTPLLAPESMIGSIAVIALPDEPPPPQPRGQDVERASEQHRRSKPGGGAVGLAPLQEALWERHRVEVPIICFPAAPKRLVRISAQLYNGPGQYRSLGDALEQELAREKNGEEEQAVLLPAAPFSSADILSGGGGGDGGGGGAAISAGDAGAGGDNGSE
jgi:isopenicillin-N epimerase